MTFGFSVTDQVGKKLFTPSGKCYVLYKIMHVGAGEGETTYHDTGVNRTHDPQPLFFVRSTERYIVSNTPPIGGVITKVNPPANDLNHIVVAHNTRSIVYLFMPGHWVEAKEGRQEWGARFYDEDGEVSYCGWQKPLTIDGYIPSGTEQFPPLRDNYSAILMRVMGEAALWVPSINQSAVTRFLISTTAYRGKVELLYLITGFTPAGYVNNYSAHIPYINGLIYEQ
ncbi:TPA: hypothetical protein ACPZBE_004073 [Morganella morganii]